MCALHSIDRIAGENNSQYAYRILHYNIMHLYLLPGQIINESELTAELNISRTPIREAIFRLREERLIDVYSQNKTCVSLIDYNLVQSALLIRASVESAVFRTLCGNLNETTKLYLFESLNRQRFYVENDALRTNFYELDNEFHKLLYVAANSEFTWGIIRHASSHLDRARYLHLHHKTSLEGVKRLYKDHETILNLIEENKPDELAALIERHVKTRPSKIWEETAGEFSDFFINAPIVAI